MLDQLAHALASLPDLLRETEGWSSLDVDYHPPRVERLVRPYGSARLCLHRIHPCPAGAALFHPHPWPCAIALLAGRYELGVGYGPSPQPPSLAARVLASAPTRYEMLEPDAWHYVRPLEAPVLSVMLSGPPWSRSASSPRPARKLGPLEPQAAESLRRAIAAALSGHAQ